MVEKWKKMQNITFEMFLQNAQNKNNAKILKSGSFNKNAITKLQNTKLNGIKYIGKNQVEILKSCVEIKKQFCEILEKNGVSYIEFFTEKEIK